MSLLVFCRDGVLGVRKGARHHAEGKYYRFDIPVGGDGRALAGDVAFPARCPDRTGRRTGRSRNAVIMGRKDELESEQIIDLGPDELARRDAEEELRDKESWMATPFDEEDMRLLTIVCDINRKSPSGLRTPDGLPPLRRL